MNDFLIPTNNLATTIVSILLLQKGVYPYENIVDSKKFNEISLPEKEDFHNHLNLILQNFFQVLLD